MANREPFDPRSATLADRLRGNDSWGAIVEHLYHGCLQQSEPLQVPNVPGCFFVLRTGWLAAPPRGTCPTLYWSSEPPPELRTLCLVSSRLAQPMDRYTHWIDAVRTTICHCHPEGDCLLTVPGMTTHPWVVRLATLLGVPVVIGHRGPDSIRPDWFAQRQVEPRAEGVWHVYAWTMAVRNAPGDPRVDDVWALPDAWPIMTAVEVRVLSVRRGGHIHQWVARRLMNRECPDQATLLLSASNRAPHQIERDDVALQAPTASNSDSETVEPPTDELQQLGAVPWHVQQASARERQAALPRVPATGVTKAKSPAAELDLDTFLAHVTRAPVRPRRLAARVDWAYYDRWLFHAPAPLDGALVNLLRILVSERLLASRHLNRSGAPVVCFTGQPVDQLSALRAFRAHLGRWDFTGYGIAIRRGVLQAAGARPVIYGEDGDWDALPESARPFFQKSASRRGQRTMDWTVEREWRVVGDVALRPLAREEAFVFVPSREEIEWIAPFSRWPVLALAELPRRPQSPLDP